MQWRRLLNNPKQICIEVYLCCTTTPSVLHRNTMRPMAGRLMADIPIIIIIGQRANTQTRLVHISLLQFFIVFCSGNRLSCNDTLWLEELKACLGIFFGCFFMSRIYSDPIAGRTDRRREPTRQSPLSQRERVLRTTLTGWMKAFRSRKANIPPNWIRARSRPPVTIPYTERPSRESPSYPGRRATHQRFFYCTTVIIFWLKFTLIVLCFNLYTDGSKSARGMSFSAFFTLLLLLELEWFQWRSITRPRSHLILSVALNLKDVVSSLSSDDVKTAVSLVGDFQCGRPAGPGCFASDSFFPEVNWPACKVVVAVK